MPRKANGKASAFDLPGLLSINIETDGESPEADDYQERMIIELDITDPVEGRVGKSGFAALSGSAFGSTVLSDEQVGASVESVFGKPGVWKLKLALQADTRTDAGKAQAKAKKAGTPATVELSSD